MKVVVTGACGFIGSHVAEALLARGDTVVGIDNLNSFYSPRLKQENRLLLEKNPGFSLVQGSILDPEALGTAMACTPDAVVHLAAWAGVRPSIVRPALYVRENIDGTVSVMDAVRAQHKPPKLIFASSSSVYGGNTKVPFHEDDAVDHPVSPYAASKRACELLAWTYHRLYNMPITCLRFFTVYGPRQRPEMAIHKFSQLLVDGAPIARYGNGKTARDYTYVADTVQGVLAAIDRCGQFGGGYRIYNLGNARTVTLDELIEKLGFALHVKPTVQELPEQPGDVPLTFADVTRAKEELGYSPDVPLEEGLRLFCEWFKATKPGRRA